MRRSTSSYISKLRAAWATWDPVSQQQVFEAYGYSDYSHQSDEGQKGSSHQALDGSVVRLGIRQSGLQVCVLLWVCLGLVSVNCKLRVPAAAKTLLAVAFRGRWVQAPSVPQGLKSKLGHGYGSQKVLQTVPKWSSLR